MIDHAEAYVDGQVHEMSDYDRFELAVSQIVGKRLTYKELIGKTEQPGTETIIN